MIKTYIKVIDYIGIFVAKIRNKINNIIDYFIKLEEYKDNSLYYSTISEIIAMFFYLFLGVGFFIVVSSILMGSLYLMFLHII